MSVSQRRNFSSRRGHALVFGVEKFLREGHPERAEQGAQAFEGLARAVNRHASAAAQFLHGQIHFLGRNAAKCRGETLTLFNGVTHRSVPGKYHTAPSTQSHVPVTSCDERTDGFQSSSSIFDLDLCSAVGIAWHFYA